MERLVSEATATDPWSVLVLDNDEAVLATVVEALRDSGLNVSAADSADASVEWAGDVIVTDTFASPYSTETVVAYLTALRSRSGAAVVVLTGHHGASTDAALLPADAVVMKPFDLDDLITVVTAVARQRREHKARTAVA